MKLNPTWSCFLFCVAVACGLHWPLPLGLTTHWTPTAYGATHTWAADHLLSSLLALENPHWISDLGYPWIREARFIGWVPSMVSWPLNPLLGPVGAFQTVVLLSVGLSGVLAARLILKLTHCAPELASMGGVLFALSPYQLSILQTGEAPKAQLWVIPMCLLAFHACLEGRKRGTYFVILAAFLTSFTSPYYGLALPLWAGLIALAAWRRKRVRAACSVLAATAVGLFPALLYFRGHPEGGLSFFRPALAPEDLSSQLPLPHPVASVSDLLLGNTHLSTGMMSTHHQSYHGLGLLLGCLFSLWSTRAQKNKGRNYGYALTAFGLLLAMGPALALHNHSTAIPLPASLLESIHYPLEAGGMYYRMVPFAVLGLTILLVSSIQSVSRASRWLALLVVIQTADSIRSTGDWPLPVEALPQHDILEPTKFPSDGAVLLVPIRAARNPELAQRSVLRQLLHGRPETPLPGDLTEPELHELQRQLNTALRSPDSADFLRKKGFRFVLYAPALSLEEHRLERDRLVRALGEPLLSHGRLIWDLGPTRIRPEPVPDRIRRANARPEDSTP